MTLRVILEAFEALDITVGTVTVGARALERLKNTVDTADMPVRLIRQGDTSSNSFLFVSCKTGIQQYTDWTITDTVLYTPIAQGSGIKQTDPEQVDYSDAYVKQLKAFSAKSTPTPNSEIQSYTLGASEINWPEGSDRYHLGVMATIIVREFL